MKAFFIGAAAGAGVGAGEKIFGARAGQKWTGSTTLLIRQLYCLVKIISDLANKLFSELLTERISGRQDTGVSGRRFCPFVLMKIMGV